MWSFIKNVITSFFWGAAEGVAYDDLPTEESFATERLAEMQSHLSQGGTVQSLCDSLPNPSACLETLLSGREELPHGWNPTSVALLAVGGTVVTLATGYWLYHSIRGDSNSDHTGTTYDYQPKSAPKDEYSGLAGATSATTPEQGLEEFAAHFHDIIAKYEGVEGELEDKTPLDDALKALVRYMFWQNDCSKATDVKEKLYRKLSLIFHTDKISSLESVDPKYKIETDDFLRYKTLVGEAGLGMLFKHLGQMNEKDDLSGGEKLLNRDKSLLAEALRKNRDYAASLQSSSAKPNTSTF